MSDKHAVEKFITKALSGLKLVNKSSHKGCESYKNKLIPRLHWPLIIYKISLSVVNCLEYKISYLRKWLNIHQSTTNIYLSSLTSHCLLPFKSFTSILKSTKVSGHLLLRESADKHIFESTSRLKYGF